MTGESISFILPKSFLLTRPLRDVTYSSFTNPSAIIFLLTRPLRDVTFQHRDYKIVDHISTHTPLTGRDSNPMWYKGGDNISTHTPLTGRDMLSSALNSCPKIFLLTRPLRDVTPDEPKPDEPKPISTHTPLTGRDCFWGGRFSKRFHFYSHAPYGTWPHKIFLLINRWISTHTPLTGRDEESIVYKSLLKISTHTPLTGRDSMSGGTASAVHLFLLTRPLRDVTYSQRHRSEEPDISTHTPLTGRDRYILYLCNGTFPHIGTDLFLLISFIWYRIYNLFIIMFFQANLKWFLNHHTFATFK